MTASPVSNADVAIEELHEERVGHSSQERVRERSPAADRVSAHGVAQGERALSSGDP